MSDDFREVPYSFGKVSYHFWKKSGQLWKYFAELSDCVAEKLVDVEEILVDVVARSVRVCLAVEHRGPRVVIEDNNCVVAPNFPRLFHHTLGSCEQGVDIYLV